MNAYIFLAAAIQPTPSPAAIASAPIESIQWVSVIAASLAMLVGLWLTFARLKDLKQGFGPNSLRALGTILLLPIVVILAVASHFQSETLAALLGTIAGYILSRSESEQKASTSAQQGTAKHAASPTAHTSTPTPTTPVVPAAARGTSTP